MSSPSSVAFVSGKVNHSSSISSSCSHIYPNPPLQYHQLPSHPIVIDRMNLYQQAHLGQSTAPVSKLLACQRSPGLGSAALSSIHDPSENYHNLSDHPSTANNHDHRTVNRESKRQLLPNQPKILNSAGVPVTGDYARYQQCHQPQQQQQHNTALSSSTFHSKIVLTDSSATSGYSSSSSLNGGGQGQMQQVQQQHSTSSLASTNSSPSSSPYPRHLLSNGQSSLPVLLESSSAQAANEANSAYKKLSLIKSKTLAQVNSACGGTLQQSRSSSTIVASGSHARAPPPPLPPHRTAANAPTPPPIPPHSSNNSTQQSCTSCDQQQQPQHQSVSTASLVNAVANSPQLQQYIREHMNALNSSNNSSSSSNTAQSNALLRSRSQPQIKGSPQPPHSRIVAQEEQVEQSTVNSQASKYCLSVGGGGGSSSKGSSLPSPQRTNSPISFGRARLKAAAMAVAEQHQQHQQHQSQENGTATQTSTKAAEQSSPSVSSAQMNEKLLAAQVAQKLQNLHLSRVK